MTTLLISAGLGTFKMVVRAHEAHPRESLSRDSGWFIYYLRVEKNPQSQRLHYSLLRIISGHTKVA